MYCNSFSIFLASGIVSLFLCCKGAGDSNSEIKSKTDTLKPCLLQTNINTIDSLTLPEAIQRFGKPVEMNEFQIDDELPIDRMGLYSFFPNKEYREKKIMITECIWSYGKDLNNNITVWYIFEKNTWKFLQKNEWEKGDEF